MSRVSAVAVPPVHRAALAWIESRSRREQRLLQVMGALLVLAVAWYGVALPLMRAREAATARIETAARLQSRLLTAPASSTATPPVAAINGDLAQVVTQRATAAGLAATGVEANGDAFAFSIDTARYDAVIAFIAALEGADGAVIRSLRIEGADQPGLVRVRMQVSRP